MYNHRTDQLFIKETTCGFLISELQTIWDEVGEPDIERDKMLVELEQECLEAYRKKVDQASQHRAQLRQAVADSEAELVHIYAILGERPVRARQFEQSAGCLKKELEAIMPHLEEMRKRKSERRSQFVEVLHEIENIAKELYTTIGHQYKTVIDDSDLSSKRMEELHNQLVSLQKEKSARLKQVLDQLNILKSFCLVLGMDFKRTISEINPSMNDSSGPKNVNANSMEKLSTAVHNLKEVKIQRMGRLQDLATTMAELWNMMDTPIKEQEKFQNVIQHIAVAENEITEPNSLSLDFINSVESEVLRLQEMKSSKMKDVLLKKRLQLENICRRAHMVAEAHLGMDYSVEAIESGAIDPSFLLEQFELQISNIKDEAFSRKDIVEKVEKWLAARKEEYWLEEYNRDDNRYNAGRGAHLILKRAEKARVLVNKIPAMVGALNFKVRAWEKERGAEFLYDGVRLLSMLEQYSILKQEKEQECQRQRDQKKLQIQLMAEQEALFGSKPSPSKSGKKVYRTPCRGASNKRFSLGGVMLQNANVEKISFSCPATKCNAVKKQGFRNQQQSGGFMALSSGKTKLDTTGVPGKEHTSYASSADENKSMPKRKPLSPVSSVLSSKVNTANIQVQNGTQNGALHKAAPMNKTPVATPTKTISADDENTTPKTIPIPMSMTPSTMPTAMQTATTPATPCVLHGIDDIENSFEERRAGFYLFETREKSQVQV